MPTGQNVKANILRKKGVQLISTQKTSTVWEPHRSHSEVVTYRAGSEEHKGEKPIQIWPLKQQTSRAPLAATGAHPRHCSRVCNGVDHWVKGTGSSGGHPGKMSFSFLGSHVLGDIAYLSAERESVLHVMVSRVRCTVCL